MDIKIKPVVTLPRRLFLFIGTILLIYPFVRLINYRVPKKPKVIEVSGTLTPGGFLTKDEFYLFGGEQTDWAVSRTCTHLGCRLAYKVKEEFLECPCHQSRFSLKGEVVRGPAKRPLPVYPVERRGNPPIYVVTIR